MIGIAVFQRQRCKARQRHGDAPDVAMLALEQQALLVQGDGTLVIASQMRNAGQHVQRGVRSQSGGALREPCSMPPARDPPPAP